jgi:DNA-binding NarL/FixJ family response regulator
MNEFEKPVRVLIAGHQFLITEALKSVLGKDGRFIVSGVVSTKYELMEALIREVADLLIIDYAFHGVTDFSGLKEIRTGFPGLRQLLLTNNLSKIELEELNKTGINNIILKSAGEEEIYSALNAVIKGMKFYSNELLDILFESTDRHSTPESGSLTNSEREIVRLITEGLTTKEIATRRHISFHTVITHRKNIFRKLSVTNTSELFMYAIKAGWIDNIEYYI